MLVKNSPAAIGTVPMYDVKGVLHKGLKDMTADDLFSVVEQHAKDGVDFMTIHAGLNRETAKHIMRNKRITNLVSRGGSILLPGCTCMERRILSMSSMTGCWNS